MCDALLVASLAATAVGTGMSAASSVARGQAEKALALENAERARRMAADATARGEFKAQAHALRAGMAEGRLESQKAEAGAGGESSVKVTSSAKLLSALEEEVIRTDAYREALGFGERADEFKRRGDLAEDAGWQGAAGSIIGGIGKMGEIGARAWSDRPRGAGLSKEDELKARKRLEEEWMRER